MTRTVKRGARTGSVDIISSKSYAHRLIILASLAKSASNIECRGTSKDIEATISCMNALGAKIARTGDTIHIEPITAAPEGVCELRRIRLHAALPSADSRCAGCGSGIYNGREAWRKAACPA